MGVKKKLMGLIMAVFMVLNFGGMPVCAEDIAVCAEPRWNNIATATLSIGFDSNNIGHFEIFLSSYESCTGLSGQMRLLDENGTLLASWAIYDDVSPFGVEKTYQCQEGKTYTLTFQGYAYGNGTTQFDDIELSVSDTCE